MEDTLDLINKLQKISEFLTLDINNIKKDFKLAWKSISKNYLEL